MSASTAELFHSLTHGVYVVGVADKGECNVFTAAWIMQISFEPLLLALSVNPRHSSYQLLRNSKAFSVNVLKAGQLDLAAQCGRPFGDDKLASVAWLADAPGHRSSKKLWRGLNAKC